MVNFTNVITHSFYARRSQKRKKLLELTVFFALLGSTCVKAAHKMLMKMTPADERESLFLDAFLIFYKEQSFIEPLLFISPSLRISLTFSHFNHFTLLPTTVSIRDLGF